MNYKKILSAVMSFIMLLSVCASVTAYADTEDQSVGEQIEEYVSEHSDTTAGMCVSVFNKTDTIYSNYFGCIDLENNIAVDENSVFEWGSVTKLLVWTSVMQLYEQGKISLDEDIRNYLPDNYLKNLTYDKPVTMINLMNHNAGFQDTPYNMFLRLDLLDKLEPLEETLSKYQPQQIYEPGTVTAYSNWGAALAGYIVERVAEKPFYEYVNDNIFKPLGMETASVKPDYSDNEFVRTQWDKLIGYRTDNMPGFAKRYASIYPAGSCVSTLDDLTKFGRALLSGDNRIFKDSATHELFFSPTSTYTYNGKEIPSNCHGMWMMPLGNPCCGHGGNSPCCSTIIILDTQNETGAAVMTNQGGELVYNIDMMEMIFGKYDPESYWGTTPAVPEGIYRCARTILKGGLKLNSLDFTRFNDSEDLFFVPDESTGIVVRGGTEYIKTSEVVRIFEISVTWLWVISVLSCVIMILIKLVQKLRKKEGHPLGKWAVTLMISEIAVIPFGIFAGLNAFNYELPADSFFWAFYVIFALTVIIVLLAFLGVILLIKTEMEKRTRAFNMIVLSTAVISAVNIIYWNLCVFWIT